MQTRLRLLPVDEAKVMNGWSYSFIVPRECNLDVSVTRCLSHEEVRSVLAETYTVRRIRRVVVTIALANFILPAKIFFNSD